MEILERHGPLHLEVLVAGGVGQEQIIGVVGVEFVFDDDAHVGVQVGFVLLAAPSRLLVPVGGWRRLARDPPGHRGGASSPKTAPDGCCGAVARSGCGSEECIHTECLIRGLDKRFMFNRRSI